MKRLLWLPAVSGLFMLHSAAAGAQSKAPAPDESAAAVPPLVYRSPFEGYRPLGEDKRGTWREVNEAVRMKAPMGGMNEMGGYVAPGAKEATPPKDAAPAKSAPAHQHQPGG